MQKIKIVQIGVTHEHAEGKMTTLLGMDDVFEVAGYVNDLQSASTPHVVNTLQPIYNGLPELTLQEVLDMPDLQAVNVETPNNELVAASLTFARKGIAVHMDKPAGENMELFTELRNLCQQRNIPFQIAYMFRGNPAFQFSLQAIKEKIIGEVISIECDMNHCYGGEPYREYISRFAGGIMYNLGCHLLDFIVAAMENPDKISSFLRSVPGDPPESRNNCFALLEYPDAFAKINVCGKTPGCIATRSMKITGTTGAITFSPLERFDGQGNKIKLLLTKPAGNFPAGEHTISFPPVFDRYREQLLKFAAMIKGEETETVYTADHDLLTHRVILAASGYTEWQQ